MLWNWWDSFKQTYTEIQQPEKKKKVYRKCSQRSRNVQDCSFLVAFELKIDEFKPEYLGKLSFSLEALDRDVKKPHENPSIGIILCKGKDDEVVEYALSRTLSPAAIADYTTKLPDKRLLQAKLHEFYDLSVREMRAEYEG